MAISKLNFPPGIKRDGTVFDGEISPNGEWVRWRMGRPRKILGWRELNAPFTGPVRGTAIYSTTGQSEVFGCSSTSVESVYLFNNGGTSGINDRTPVGLSPNDNYVWQSAVLYDSVSTGAVILLHPGANLQDIDNAETSTVYIGSLGTGSALTAITGTDVSGGCAVFGQYGIYYGSDGHFIASVANNPNDITNTGSLDANICGDKIVKGLPVRAGGSAPAGILWSLSNVIRASFVGGTPIWSFDTVTSFSSIMSSSGVVEYDGQFFWVGADRFFNYNGVVRDLPNDYNQDYFFNNVNPLYRQKVFGIAIPRYGEIWWFYPHGDSVECNNAIVLNVKSGFWFDLNVNAPGALRTSGLRPTSGFPYPLLFSAVPDSGNKYYLCQHEFGVDRIDINNNVLAVNSFVETPDISLPAAASKDLQTRLERMEPDFVMNGEMTMTVTGNDYAQAPSYSSEPFPFNGDTKRLDPRQQRRELRLLLQSNQVGGYYEMGQVLVELEEGDARQ